MTSHFNIPFEELCSLYAKASLLVVPSRYEAFSYAALEALSYGTPVLLSDRVRIADYLTNINGISIFKYQNFKEFVDKVHEGVKMVVTSDDVKKVFDETIIKEKYKQVFLSLKE